MPRIATQDDLPECLRLCKLFHAESQYSDIPLNEKHLLELLTQLCENQFLIIDEGCVFGFVVFPVFFNQDYLMAQELFFYVEPTARGKGKGKEALLFAESKAQELGAKKLNMLCLESNRIDGLYRAMGYNQEEVIFSKGL